LTATLVGGFVAATAGAIAVWQYGSGRGQELTDDLARSKDDLGRVWELVHLHEKLDDMGLENVVTAGLAAVELETVELGGPARVSVFRTESSKAGTSRMGMAA